MVTETKEGLQITVEGLTGFEDNEQLQLALINIVHYAVKGYVAEDDMHLTNDFAESLHYITKLQKAIITPTDIEIIYALKKRFVDSVRREIENEHGEGWVFVPAPHPDKIKNKPRK